MTEEQRREAARMAALVVAVRMTDAAVDAIGGARREAPTDTQDQRRVAELLKSADDSLGRVLADLGAAAEVVFPAGEVKYHGAV